MCERRSEQMCLADVAACVEYVTRDNVDDSPEWLYAASVTSDTPTGNVTENEAGWIDEAGQYFLNDGGYLRKMFRVRVGPTRTEPIDSLEKLRETNGGTVLYSPSKRTLGLFVGIDDRHEFINVETLSANGNGGLTQLGLVYVCFESFRAQGWHVLCCSPAYVLK